MEHVNVNETKSRDHVCINTIIKNKNIGFRYRVVVVDLGLHNYFILVIQRKHEIKKLSIRTFLQDV